MSAPPATTPIVDACELVRSRGEYSGKRIESPGIVMGERLDSLMLITGNCQFGVHLVFASEVQAHQDVKALFAAVRRGNPGTTDRDITADFFGTYFYSEQGSILELRVEKLEQLKYPRS